jgi:hypothetical protein
VEELIILLEPSVAISSLLVQDTADHPIQSR